MECPQEDLKNILREAVPENADALNRYIQLCSKSELDDSDSEQLASIYTQAEFNSSLHASITKVDRILGEHTGLMDAEAIEGYKNQQAWLREHLDQVPLEQDHLFTTQKFLKETGFYDGPLDGIWGDRMKMAVINYRKKVQQLLQQRGHYSGHIDGELGIKSVLAVKEFQKSNSLKDDGVPLQDTFSTLKEKERFFT